MRYIQRTLPKAGHAAGDSLLTAVGDTWLLFKKESYVYIDKDRGEIHVFESWIFDRIEGETDV